MKVPPAATRTSQIRFGVLCVLGYVVLSWALRFDMRLGGQIASIVYPLDTFSMYAGSPGEDRSHLLIRDRQGSVHRITAFRSFDCAEAVDVAAIACAERRGIPYMVEDFARYIQTHKGTGELEVDVIARTWELHAGAAPTQLDDCVVTRCKVSP